MDEDNSLKKTYLKDSAGRMMTKNVPVACLNDLIGDIEKLIVNNAGRFDTINYIYIVGQRKKLKGVISIKELYRQEKKAAVKKVMKKDPITARANTDKERVAYKALHNNIKSVPIVDKNNNFLGVVQNDNIMKTLYEESREDMLQLAGVHSPREDFDDITRMPVAISLRHRFPWLFVGLIGGMLIARIIGVFEATLTENIIIAAFIPLVVYMAGAASMQMAAIMIRDLAINPDFIFIKYIAKQFIVVFFLSGLSSVFFVLLSYLLYNDLRTSLVLGLAMFSAIMSSIITGQVVPYAINKLKFDPANASGPLGTIIQDTLTVLIYFSVITAML